MNDALISIIIPVYNVEKYINRCLESVINQTYKNIEIILVDDGSPDRSGEICENFSKTDSRIKVFHKMNGGLSDARNYGVKKANGAYITFIDSDDYVSVNYITYLYNILQKNHADISCCCMVKTNTDSTQYTVNTCLPEEQLFTGWEASMALLDNLYLILVTAWGKLYRSDIVKKYPFPVGRKHEDEATSCKFYYEAERVVIGNECLYAYFQNPKSITHTKGTKLNTDELWALEHRAKFYEEQNEHELAANAWSILFSYCARDSKENEGRCDDIIRDHIANKSLLKRTRFEVVLYNISHWGYWQYKNLREICGRVKLYLKSDRQ